MDPDNGLQEANDPRKRDAEKYVLPDEIAQYYKAGHNVVYYCHKGRRKLNEWEKYISIMCRKLPDAKPRVFTFHKGTQRSYIFLIHPEDFEKYSFIIQNFMNRWTRLFSEEYTEKGDVSSEKVGEEFKIENSNGAVLTLRKRADGSIQINNSKVSTEYRCMSPDLLFSLIWS